MSRSKRVKSRDFGSTIDYSKSEIIEKRRVETGPLCKFYRGITIDEWDRFFLAFPDASRAEILERGKTLMKLFGREASF